ncbi:MAG: hypothetical protein EOP19_09005 [Hyphomicrobiales bacterium]|nr:MAG: hypothetical protein EOP19_09005 [Hyphomicrobiales bacterium]
MSLNLFGRVAGVLALTVGLAGCMDVTMEIDVLSETTGKSTTTSVMGADIYSMVKAGAAEDADDDGFCKEAGETLTENADGSATCVLVAEGPFAELNGEDGKDDGAKFEVVSPGVVKVSFSTEDMKKEVGTDIQDEETKAMMVQFFEGRAITIRIKGKDVIDTNMTRKGNAAEIVIPFLDLINGKVDLPDELYATVKVN